ncbi:MAG: four helix bundle protein [Pseudomonadota bacterium]
MSQALSTKIYADSYALTLTIFQRTKAIPKAHRPTIGRGLEESSLSLLFEVRSAGVAHAIEQKKQSCLGASNALDRLRIYAQVSKDLGFFSDGTYFEISEKTGEVGRQLGGWLKSMGKLKG